jgi:hypothetical protein
MNTKYYYYKQILPKVKHLPNHLNDKNNKFRVCQRLFKNVGFSNHVALNFKGKWFMQEVLSSNI